MVYRGVMFMVAKYRHHAGGSGLLIEILQKCGSYFRVAAWLFNDVSFPSGLSLSASENLGTRGFLHSHQLSPPLRPWSLLDHVWILLDCDFVFLYLWFLIFKCEIYYLAHNMPSLWLSLDIFVWTVLPHYSCFSSKVNPPLIFSGHFIYSSINS